MSICRCDFCFATIDSDADVDCFIGDTDIVACARCRERMAERGELDTDTNQLIKVAREHE